MIYHATKLIEKAFNEAGLKCDVEEFKDSSFVSAGFSIEKGPSVRVNFISSDDDNDVSVRLFRLCSDVDDAARPKILEAVNQLNESYRFVKFVLDKDGDVNVEYELPLKMSDDCLGACCAEIFVRLMKIIGDAYPVLMKTLWS